METEQDYYNDGFKTGAKWDKNWRPGGPFVATEGVRDSDEVKRVIARQRANRAAWIRGFNDSQKDK